MDANEREAIAGRLRERGQTAVVKAMLYQKQGDQSRAKRYNLEAIGYRELFDIMTEIIPSMERLLRRKGRAGP